MSGFSFPPPPPPPPKDNATDGQHSTPQSGGRDQERGRGRGSRGNFQSRVRGYSGGRGQSQSQRGRGHLYQNANASPLQSQFVSHSTYDHADQAAYPSPPTLPQGPPSSNDQHSAGSPPRTVAGHKRKLDALRGPPQKKPEKKVAPATAPAIPTFGALLLTAPPSIEKKNSPPASCGRQSHKPPNRSLGLTPGTGDTQYSSSDNEEDGEDFDEEAMYAELGDKLTFEHNGVVMSLDSQADLLAWKQDRKKNWPTKARMATKDEERKQVGEERKRLLAGVEALYGSKSRFSKPGSNIWTSAKAAGLSESGVKDQASVEAQTPETNLEKARREMVEKTKRLEELRRKVTESEARNRKAREREQQNQSQIGSQANEVEAVSPSVNGEIEMDAVPTGVEADDANGAEEQPTPGALLDETSSSESDSKSDSDSTSSDDDSDDEPPEEVTSKEAIDVPPATDQHRVCRYFQAGGRCREGDACRFRHDPTEQSAHKTSGQQQEPQRQGHVRKDQRPPKLEQKSEKKTIFQRLVEQEEAEDDRLVLKAVKYLGEAGFFR